MKQDFTEIMSKRTDEELIEIVQVKRDSYHWLGLTFLNSSSLSAASIASGC